MELSEYLILRLNDMLYADSFNKGEFKNYLNNFIVQFKPKIKIIDFKYFSDYRRKLAKKEKIKCVKIQDFEKAAHFRVLEKECLNHISIRADYKIDKSSFKYDSEYLFYFHLGKSKNEKIVKDLLTELIQTN